VLVIGRGSGIARAVVLASRDAGAHVVAAGRNAVGVTLSVDGGESLT
jgi:NAD(P)-dependent dehydrogenase (short-subunit alcohol dehydrogenase family)